MKSEADIETILKSEKLKVEFLEIFNISRDDRNSDVTIGNSGQRILKNIVNKKSILQVLNHLYQGQFQKVKENFKRKMMSFERHYNQQRLNNYKPNTIRNSELEKLNIEYRRLGGDELKTYIGKSFHDFCIDIPSFSDSLSLISADFERNYDFFTAKDEVDFFAIEHHNISQFVENQFKESGKQWERFISKHLNKIFYVNALEEYIIEIENFKGEEEIEETTQYTLKRQIIAIMLLLKKAGLNHNDVDNKAIAKFIRFLTKVGLTQSDIKNTTIYTNLPRVDLRVETDDLNFVLEQFEKLKIEDIQK